MADSKSQAAIAKPAGITYVNVMIRHDIHA